MLNIVRLILKSMVRVLLNNLYIKKVLTSCLNLLQTKTVY
nr:MAG TPA: hypothetical protein [Caudoviricetes sp.]